MIDAHRTTETAEPSMRRVAAAAIAGTSIEWYDFFIYGTAAALVFPTVFFPADIPPLVALMASFSTFAVGFFARPVGGIIFGHFGDRVGRKTTLVIALLMMAVATVLIGCLPTYATAGAAAPLALIVLRFVQGLAIGGQWGGAMLLVTESAPSARRGFYGSFAQAGAPVGVVLANLAFLLVSNAVSPEAFLQWGWRVPFLSSIVLIALSLYIQLKLEDTPAFLRLQALKASHDEASDADITRPEGGRSEAAVSAHRRSPVLEAIRLYPKQIALSAGAFLAVQVPFYILITFVIAYGTGAQGPQVPRSVMLTGVLVASLVQVPALFLFGSFSDRYGRRGIYLAGALLSALWSFALFPLIDTGSLAWIIVALTVGQVLVAMMYGPQAAFLTEMFATHVRYSGASLGYQFGAIIGGGLAPIIATALLAETGDTLAIAWYMAIACAITFVSVLFLKETYRTDLHAPHL